MDITPNLYAFYSLCFKGNMIGNTLRKLGAIAMPTCVLFYDKTTSLATSYLTPSPTKSLFLNELECGVSSIGSYYEYFKDLAYHINAHPLMGALKAFSLIKQTVDSYITYSEWLSGERSSKSLVYHSSHLLIAYTPVILSQTELGQTWEGQFLLNLCMLSGLTFSITQDLFSTRWKLSSQEAESPSSKLLKKEVAKVASSLVVRQLKF